MAMIYSDSDADQTDHDDQNECFLIVLYYYYYTGNIYRFSSSEALET